MTSETNVKLCAEEMDRALGELKGATSSMAGKTVPAAVKRVVKAWEELDRALYPKQVDEKWLVDACAAVTRLRDIYGEATSIYARHPVGGELSVVVAFQGASIDVVVPGENKDDAVFYANALSASAGGVRG